MNVILRKCIVVVVILLVAFANVPSSVSAQPLAQEGRAYLDPTLAAISEEDVSVIVTGRGRDTAKQAVASAGGQVTSDLWLIDAVGATIPSNALRDLSANPGVMSIVKNSGISVNGKKPNWDAIVSDQAWPFSADVGADQLHTAGVTGQGIGVAVVDSGVFYDQDVRKAMDYLQSPSIFLGEADFVGAGLCNGAGEQLPDHCFYDETSSTDLYGHGSHVAGIINNPLHAYQSDITMGVAPAANILSVRILDENGVGTYEDAIEGIQYVVQHKDDYDIRVMNLSLSAEATVPYFVDPLDRAVEQAWASGIVVVAAAGNSGPNAESITVPGNDPYVITVGAVDSGRTAGDFSDDTLPGWTANGPTGDGFIKPDVLAPGKDAVSFMHNADFSYIKSSTSPSAKLTQLHPDYSTSSSFFRMSGTSMATAITSGVVALMLQVHPELTPDQVKFRLMQSTRVAVSSAGEPVYGPFQQGMGRVWAPDAVLASFPTDGVANVGMDIQSDLAHGFSSDADLAFHYQGPVRKALSDDGSAYLYYLVDSNGQTIGLGSTLASDGGWLDWTTLSNGIATWSGSQIDLNTINWAGGIATWSGGIGTWSGGIGTWSGGIATWSGGIATWSGGIATWSGGIATWSGSVDIATAGVGATTWVGDDWGVVLNSDSTSTTATVSTTDSTQLLATTSTSSTVAAPTNSLHLSALTGTGFKSGKKWQAQVTVGVADSGQSPVANATIVGSWTGKYSGSASCVTDSSGQCNISTSLLSGKIRQVTFAVDSVTHPDYVYQPEQDLVSAQVTVNKP